MSRRGQSRMVETVLGPVPVEALGRTFMHKHLQVAAPGWNFDTLDPPMPFTELVRRCVDHVEELKGASSQAMARSKSRCQPSPGR